MKIDYIYQTNQTIQKNLTRIEIAEGIMEFLQQYLSLDKAYRDKALLRSAVYSARIEGNTFPLNKIEALGKGKLFKTRERQEVLNLLTALKWIYSASAPKELNMDVISKLQRRMLLNMSFYTGSAMKKPSQSTKALERLISFWDKSSEHPVINAAFVHFAFAKMNPFVDGNAKLNRLLTRFLLKNAGYDFRGFAMFEKYLEQNRDEYDSALSLPGNDITTFVEFFTETLATCAEEIISVLKKQKEEPFKDTLPARTQTILDAIREHKHVPFITLSEKFPDIAISTLHYDITRLRKAGFIKMLGKGQRARYVIK